MRPASGPASRGGFSLMSRHFAGSEQLAADFSWRFLIAQLPSAERRKARTSNMHNSDPPPTNGNGAPAKSAATMMSNTSPADCALLAQRSSELRLACCALSRLELREWLEAKHSRRITKEGSDADGRILAICPEFVCVERPDRSRVVESTSEVDRALAIALFGISDAGDSDMRLALARALRGLAEHAAGQPIDRNELLNQLSCTLGKLVLSVLNTPPALVRVGSTRKEALAKYSTLAESSADWAHSPPEQRRKAELAVQDAVTAMRSALGARVHWKFPSPDKRSTQPDKISLVWPVQLTAKQIFRKISGDQGRPKLKRYLRRMATASRVAALLPNGEKSFAWRVSTACHASS